VFRWAFCLNSSQLHEKMRASFIIDRLSFCRTCLSKAQVRPVQETAHKMVWTLEVEWARGQNVPSDEIMHKDKRLKPGMITMLSLSQKVHSDELSGRLLDIIREYSSVLRKVIPR
jgi:hypothetical protein